MTWPERAQISFRQLEKSHRRAQTPAMLGMGGVLEIFFKMDERARRLNQTLEEVVVVRIGV